MKRTRLSKTGSSPLMPRRRSSSRPRSRDLPSVSTVSGTWKFQKSKTFVDPNLCDLMEDAREVSLPSDSPPTYSLEKANDSLMGAFKELAKFLDHTEPRGDQWWNTKSDPLENIQQTIINLCDRPNLISSSLKLLKAFALSVIPQQSKKSLPPPMKEESPLKKELTKTLPPRSLSIGAFDKNLLNRASSTSRGFSTPQPTNLSGSNISARAKSGSSISAKRKRKKEKGEKKEKEKSEKKERESSKLVQTQELVRSKERKVIATRHQEPKQSLKPNSRRMQSASPMLQTFERSFSSPPRSLNCFDITQPLISPKLEEEEEEELLLYRVDFREAKITKVLAPLGGSGAVVFSVDVNGLQCAMKEFSFERQRLDKEQSKKFFDEIKMVENLRHPNIVRYLGHEVQQNSARLFLTRYESTLRKEVQQRWADVESDIDDPFRPRDIAQVVLDLSRGLEYLHDHKVIHRDIKSDNMFVNFDERGNIREVVIADFDTSKILLTDQTKTTIGTPCYMAPEVINANFLGYEGYTVKADIWSFGMIIYELLTLNLPYAGIRGGDMKAAQDIREGNRPPLPSPKSNLPREEDQDSYKPLIDLFFRCCLKDPEKRLDAGFLAEKAEKILMSLNVTEFFSD